MGSVNWTAPPEAGGRAALRLSGSVPVPSGSVPVESVPAASMSVESVPAECVLVASVPFESEFAASVPVASVAVRVSGGDAPREGDSTKKGGVMNAFWSVRPPSARNQANPGTRIKVRSDKV